MKFAAAVALLVAVGVSARADTPAAVLWIDRPEAQPWLPALQYAADRTALPVALLAELIGSESGFRNIANPHSSARGFGQQVSYNRIMLREHLNPMRPPESILGAAIELRERLDASGSLNAALRGYGTTAALSPVRRRAAEARFAAAEARDRPSPAVARVAAAMVAQRVAPVTIGQMRIP